MANQEDLLPGTIGLHAGTAAPANTDTQPTEEVRIDINAKQENMRLRLAEYTAIYENTAALSDRRQNINNFFAGINTLFLTAFGYLLIQLQLVPWWPAVIFTGLTIPITFINVNWLRLNHRYRNLTRVRITYMAKLEAYLQTQGFEPLNFDMPAATPKEQAKPLSLVGIHTYESETSFFKGGPKVGFSSIEQNIIVTFLVSYLIITALVIVFSILNATGAVPPFPAIK